MGALFLLFSGLGVAEDLTPMSSQQLMSLPVNFEHSDWFDCGENEGQRFCSDRISYYKVPVFGEVVLSERHDLNTILLSAAFSLTNYNDIQLNLRRDGFSLQKVVRGQEVFDVQVAIQHQGVEETDKALVLFLNKGGIAQPVEMEWQRIESLKPLQVQSAKFYSDGEQVTLSFTAELLEDDDLKTQP
ncbi:hypothetical protein J4N42_16230 [Vibrio sp. SCSIO 43135]|uniref:hypothetical protein n=1 Tax=Vibrio sp. SCSIO 43135 TaxID=2819096 RepID=UPI002075862D|nr:hypothetical protein [Vibrio sp. SCSIO 43135]USD43717.1 hypothetical protein J4N42_16230 [Vibrio sp. SCSIO 43135]